MERWQSAYQDWQKGMSYREISAKYGVSERTVRSWQKCKWKLSNDEKNICDKSRGKFPKKPCVKPEKKVLNKVSKESSENISGEEVYEKLLYSLLISDEQKLFGFTQIDEAGELKKTIRLCDIQIIRFMHKIEQSEEKLKNFEAKDDFEKNLSLHELIRRYNAEIERIKKQKIKCLEILIKITNDYENLKIAKLKLEMQKIEKESDIRNKTDINVKIYIPENER